MRGIVGDDAVTQVFGDDAVYQHQVSRILLHVGRLVLQVLAVDRRRDGPFDRPASDQRTQRPARMVLPRDLLVKPLRGGMENRLDAKH